MKDSGLGVYLTEGEACPGTVLGFYPGDVYRDGGAPPTADGEPSEYAITRSSSDILDGHPGRETVSTAVERSPYAIGHMINHPDDDDKVNCAFWPFTFAR